MNFRGFFEITRPLNSLVSGFAAVLGFVIASGTIPPFSLILFPVAVLITAGGNVINDYFDAAIDAINRPGRPIPSGDVCRSHAGIYACLLFVSGILIALLTNPLCILIAVFNTLILIGYAAKLKTTPLAGNIAVSYLSASLFLFGGALAGPGGLYANLPLAIITFLAMLTRELLKDAEDMEGDAVCGARTLPIMIGIRKTSRLAFIVAIFAAGASMVPVFRWGVLYLAGISVVDFVILSAAFRALSCDTPACVRGSKATTLLKAGFFGSLSVFLLSAMYLH